MGSSREERRCEMADVRCIASEMPYFSQLLGSNHSASRLLLSLLMSMGRSSLKRGYNMAALWEEREKDDGRATFFQCFNNILDDEKVAIFVFCYLLCNLSKREVFITDKSEGSKTRNQQTLEGLSLHLCLCICAVSDRPRQPLVGFCAALH